MKVQQKMQLKQRQKMQMFCPICELMVSCDEDHAPGCPMLVIKEILCDYYIIRCPDETGRNGLMFLNVSDFYECEDCHTQFTRGPLWMNGKKYIVEKQCAELAVGGYFDVYKVAEKGTGRFRPDQAIEAAKKQWEEFTGQPYVIEKISAFLFSLK